MFESAKDLGKVFDWLKLSPYLNDQKSGLLPKAGSWFFLLVSIEIAGVGFLEVFHGF